MGSIKIIVFIIIIVIGIVKTIIGDAKKDKEQSRPMSTPGSKATPEPQIPSYEPHPLTPPVAMSQEGGLMSQSWQNEGVSSIPMQASSIGSIEERHELTEEERIAHAERWRQALIDSEILKRKF